ncbi:hypothetical protein C9374_012056 [Naegleria lovaniensis]|uniref:GAIN-B domain-containing protein n=1 Tax=Naegleria lovaniensis TaxID=51637 RepID=A0AA88KCU4_NAELO|nr:uncharacterized protein C9374_012056 [Naegleria lovaniensis]KAG2373593.1 hypothetical protein C9374_012056 [Naegleria lovaniensis]
MFACLVAALHIALVSSCGMVSSSHPPSFPVYNISNLAGGFERGDGYELSKATLGSIFGGMTLLDQPPRRALYLTDTSNSLLRRIDLVQSSIQTEMRFEPPLISLPAGVQPLYSHTVFNTNTFESFVCDRNAHVIHRIHSNGTASSVFAGVYHRSGYNGDSIPSNSSWLNTPMALVVDPKSGDLIVADSLNHRIRKISALTGLITTIAGNGQFGYSGNNGLAIDATLNAPSFIALSPLTNELYIADTNNHVVRKITPNGAIVTVAGSGLPGYSGDGSVATASECRLNSPQGIALNPFNNDLYIADTFNHVIRKVSFETGVITTVAGNGTAGFNGDAWSDATQAQLFAPSGVAVDPLSGDVYIADEGNLRIRVLNSRAGILFTLVGSRGVSYFTGDNVPALETNLQFPKGLALSNDGSSLFVADSSLNRIRKVSLTSADGSNFIQRFAGSGAVGFGLENVEAVLGQLTQPGGVFVESNGNVLIADSANNRIRRVNIAQGTIQTIAGTSVLHGSETILESAFLRNPLTLAISPLTGDIFIADLNNHIIRKVDIRTRTISTFAGTAGLSGDSGDHGPATRALISYPRAIAISPLTGEVYFSCSSKVKKVLLNGTLVTAAGTGAFNYTGDHGLATEATFKNPTSLAFMSNGDLLIGDTGAFVIRKVSASTGIITTLAGNGTYANVRNSGDDGNALNAQFRSLSTISVGRDSNSLEVVYVVDNLSALIRKIYPVDANNQYMITTMMGLGDSQTEGASASSWKLISPKSVKVSPSNGELYIVEACSLVKVSVEGRVQTIAGTTKIPTVTCGSFNGDGLALTRVFESLRDVALLNETVLYVLDDSRLRVLTMSLNEQPNAMIMVSTLIGREGDGGPALLAKFQQPTSVFSTPDGTIYIADSNHHRIRKISAQTGIISTIAGVGSCSSAGDGSAATLASLCLPMSVVVDSMSGEVFIADTMNHKIRKIFSNGTIVSIAGMNSLVGTSNGNITTEDGVDARSIQLNQPTSLFLSPKGSLYFSDSRNYKIRRITPNGLIWTIAGNGTAGYQAASSLATETPLNAPQGLVISRHTGELFIADTYNHRIRVMRPYCLNHWHWDAELEECLPCPKGYTGIQCQVPICFGFRNDSNLSCNRNGICMAPDTCKCLNQWSGLDCSILNCASVSFDDPTKCVSSDSSSSSSQTKTETIPQLENLSSKTINFTTDTSVKAQFPSTLTQHLIEQGGLNRSQPITVLSSLYIPPSQSQNRTQTEAPVLSSVLTISLYNSQGQKISVQKLQEPIELFFSNIHVSGESSSAMTSIEHVNITCMYFNEEKKEWASDGIVSHLQSSTPNNNNNGFIISMKCQTFHLTSFAVIDKNFKKATNQVEDRTPNGMSDTTLIAIVVSSVGSVLVISVVVLITVVVLAVYYRGRKLKRASV